MSNTDLHGWSRGTWNSGAWNKSIPLEVSGVQAATAVGSATISLPRLVSVTGVSAASAVGTSTVLIVTRVSVTGVSAASAVGSPTPTITSIFSPSGVSAASATGSVQINFTFAATGVETTTAVGNTLIWQSIDSSQTPNWTQIAA